MPCIFNKIICVRITELVPKYYTKAALSAAINRHKNSPYGINRVQRGGNGRMLLIELESLPGHIQEELCNEPYVHYQTIATNYASKNSK